MTITYPIDLPSSPRPSGYTLNGISSSALTQSPFSGSQQIQLMQSELWTFSLSLPPMNSTQAREWFASMKSLKGRYGTFYWGDPRWTAPVGTWAGTPVVDGASQTGYVLNIRGLDTGATIKAGDMIQIGTDSSRRLHIVTVDAVENGSGGAAVDIWPALREATTDGISIVTSSPKGVFRLSTNAASLSWQPFKYGMELEIMEAL